MSDILQAPSPDRPARRRLGVVAGVVILLVVGALVAGYLVFFTPDSPDRLTLTPSSGVPTSAATDEVPTDTSDLAGRWTTVEGSEAGYRVREKLANLPAASDAVGRTNKVTGAMTVSGDDDRFVARDLRIEVDLTSLQSDESRRDNRIRTSGLESARFPTATFVAAEDIVAPADAPSGKAFTTDVTGDLTLHGVTKRVTIPVQARLDGRGLEVVGSLKFPMSTFDITPPNVGGFVTVESDATLEFKILMRKA